MEPVFEDQFTAFIDLLGFKKAILKGDENTISNIKLLLTDLSELRGDFSFTSEGTRTVQTSRVRPTVSAFSDCILISYPLRQFSKELKDEAPLTLTYVLSDFSFLLTQIAATALRSGLLVQGGATVGNLYHKGGVAFGKALIRAYEIQSTVSVYPRVILSTECAARLQSLEVQTGSIAKCDDGLYHFDYFSGLARAAGGVAWIQFVNDTINRNLSDLRKQTEPEEKAIAKWEWFGREFRNRVEWSKSHPPMVSCGAVPLSNSPGSISESWETN
ncbi:MAG: hypothetical protein ABR912_05145 [Terracidiphilus sp.]|jgi:hypothetical protein